MKKLVWVSANLSQLLKMKDDSLVIHCDTNRTNNSKTNSEEMVANDFYFYYYYCYWICKFYSENVYWSTLRVEEIIFKNKDI